MFGIFTRKKPKSHLAKQIESRGLDQVTTEVVGGLMRQLSKTGYMFNFILGEIDGASMGNEKSQCFARGSGIPESEYKGAHLFNHPLIDGPNGAKTLMDAACLAMLDEHELMVDFRLMVLDKLMRQVEVGKYNTACADRAAAAPSRSNTTVVSDIALANEALFQLLRRWRADTAHEQAVPAYVILHDKTLRELAEARPASHGLLVGITGMDSAKIERYGEELLALIRDAG